LIALPQLIITNKLQSNNHHIVLSTAGEMKKLIFRASIILVANLSNVSLAENKEVSNFYAGSKDSITEDRNVFLGYRLADLKNAFKNTRIEQSFSQTNAMSGNVSYERVSSLSNFIYDLKRNKHVNSYVGVAAGFTNISDDYARRGDNLSPTYKVMTGFSYQPKHNKKLKLQVGYSYEHNPINNRNFSGFESRDFEGSGHILSSHITIKF
jgi:opacity protein-like surface antigen